MASNQITIKLTLKWWLRYYLYGVVLMAWLTGQEPDTDKMGHWIAKGTKVWIS